MKRYSFWIDEKQLAALTARGKKTGVPVAEQIRRAIAKYLKRREVKPWQRA